MITHYVQHMELKMMLDLMTVDCWPNPTFINVVRQLIRSLGGNVEQINASKQAYVSILVNS